MSHDSPTSSGLESVSSGSWPWKRMWRCWCRNSNAGSETPGNFFSLGSCGLGQRLDQSERTKTTLPAGMVPCLISHARMSETFSE